MASGFALKLPIPDLGEVVPDADHYQSVVNDVAASAHAEFLEAHKQRLEDIRGSYSASVSKSRHQLETLVFAVECLAADGVLDSSFGVSMAEIVEKIDSVIDKLHREKTGRKFAEMRDVANRVRRIDAARGALLRDLLDTIHNYCDQMINMLRAAKQRIAAAQKIATKDRGVIARARAAYLRALPRAFVYAKATPELEGMWHEGMLYYELVIRIPSRLYENTQELVGLESTVHDAVENEDPSLVGRLALRYEPIGA